MARRAILPQLSEIQKHILLSITKLRASGQHLVRRVRIVLLASEGYTNEDIAPQVPCHVNTAQTWRSRWNQQQATLATLEATGDEKALRAYIVGTVLADDPSNGKRGKYTPEQITQLYAIACEKPEDSGRPISHWSCRELGNEMVKRGIVEKLPTSTVWDFLKSGRLEAAQSGRLDESQIRRSYVPRAK